MPAKFASEFKELMLVEIRDLLAGSRSGSAPVVDS